MKGQFDKMLKMTLNLVSGQFDVCRHEDHCAESYKEYGGARKSASRLLCVSAFV